MQLFSASPSAYGLVLRRLVRPRRSELGAAVAPRRGARKRVEAGRRRSGMGAGRHLSTAICTASAKRATELTWAKCCLGKAIGTASVSERRGDASRRLPKICNTPSPRGPRRAVVHSLHQATLLFQHISNFLFQLT